MYENKVKWCPICNQGWVEIVKKYLQQLYSVVVRNVNQNGTPHSILQKQPVKSQALV